MFDFILGHNVHLIISPNRVIGVPGGTRTPDTNGAPTWNRTKKCALEGRCYIHLTTEAFFKTI